MRIGKRCRVVRYVAIAAEQANHERLTLGKIFEAHHFTSGVDNHGLLGQDLFGLLGAVKQKLAFYVWMALRAGIFDADLATVVRG